ncbi:MAG: gliding motility-associated C-terminal domain-containing protein [Flavobacteriales bacterium]|jgi:hypothetical protein|nr:gliding motility-associated C-terminal domain-containing protein [Flavobacteriales bacterium]
MNWRFTFLFFSLTLSTLAQTTSITDNFSDGDFVQNPTWKGDTALFQVDNYQLRLNGNSALAPSFLGLSSEIIDSAHWQFYTQMDFNPSSSNFLEIILYSEDSLHTIENNQLIVEVGRSSDKIRVLKVLNGQKETVTETTSGIFSGNYQTIWWNIEHENQTWQINYSLDSLNWQSLPHFSFAANQNKLFGFRCRYTSTRKDKFWFDNINIQGSPFQDKTPPKITHFTSESNQYIHLKFSEKILITSAEIKTQAGAVPKGQQHYGDSLILDFTNLEYNKKHLLNLKNIQDLKGNSLDTSFTVLWSRIKAYDILISEILPTINTATKPVSDPCIELYNPSEFGIQLSEFTLKIDQKEYLHPSFWLEPNAVVLVYDKEAKNFKTGKSKIVLDKTFYLKKTGSSLSIWESDHPIHWVSYTDDWFQTDFKKDGNWSLELIKPNKACLGKWAWEESTAPSGETLGEINSEHEMILDKLDPLFLYCPTDSVLEITFPVLTLENLFVNDTFYTISKAIKYIERINGNSFRINFKKPLKNGELEQISFENLPFCDENVHFPQKEFFYNSSKPQEGIIINEIRFETTENHVEYIEIYNQNEYPIESSQLVLGVYTDQWNYQNLPEKNQYISAKSYAVLTKNKKLLEVEYDLPEESNLIEMHDFPNLNNTGGKIGFFNTSIHQIDQACYESSWHSSGVENTENKALEKIDFELNGCQSNTWATASSTQNYGTPGRINSQVFIGKTEDFMELFTPNGDGDQDFWNYYKTFSSPENLLDVHIYSLNGVLKKSFFTKKLIGNQIKIQWNGADENGNQLSTGTYIFWLKNYSTGEEVKKAINLIVEIN